MRGVLGGSRLWLRGLYRRGIEMAPLSWTASTWPPNHNIQILSKYILTAIHAFVLLLMSLLLFVRLLMKETYIA